MAIRTLKTKAEAPVFWDWQSLERVKALIYGISGTGKTYLLNSAPRPMVVFHCWGGVMSLERDPEIQVVNLDVKTDNGKEVDRNRSEKFELFDSNINYWMANPEEHPKTVAIDLFSQFYEDTVTGITIAGGSKDKRQDYGQAQDWFKVMMPKLQSLSSHIVLTCLEDNREGEISPNVSPGLKSPIISWCDVVLRLVTYRDKEAKERELKRALITVPMNNAVARVRGQAGSFDEVIKEPDLSEVIDAVMGDSNGDS